MCVLWRVPVLTGHWPKSQQHPKWLMAIHNNNNSLHTNGRVCASRRPLAIGSLGISGRGHTIKSITPPPINSIRFAITVIARSQILASWSSPSRWTHQQSLCPFAHPTSTTSSSATCAEMRRIDFPFHCELFIFMRFHMFSNWIL